MGGGREGGQGGGAEGERGGGERPETGNPTLSTMIRPAAKFLPPKVFRSPAISVGAPPTMMKVRAQTLISMYASLHKCVYSPLSVCMPHSATPPSQIKEKFDSHEQVTREKRPKWTNLLSGKRPKWTKGLSGQMG